MELRFNMQMSGDFNARKLTPEATLLALKTTLERRESARAATPAPWIEPFDQVMDEVQRTHDALEAQLARRVRVEESRRAITPPEAVADLASPETLGSRQGVNNLLDAWVGSLQSGLESKVIFPGPKGEDARALLALWFPDGKSFLTYTNARQWLAIDQRWAKLEPDVQARAARLDLSDTLAALQALNAWFRTLLQEAGELPDTPTPESDLTPAALQALMRLLAFAAAAWPGSEGEPSRRRLVDPYLDAVRAASAARNGNLKRAPTPSPEPPLDPPPLA